MEREQVTQIEQLERMQKELQDQLARSQQEMRESQEQAREQMAKMMEMMLSLTQGKDAVERIVTQGEPSGMNPRAHLFDSVTVQDLDDPLEQEKLKKHVEKQMEEQKYDMLEERLRAIEGMDVFGSVDANELSLVPNLVLPPKFKVPEFEKYDGSGCPSTHIIMYCRKMASHTDNDKLLIHCFQDSLAGSAVKWYSQLDRNRICHWKDLARAFMAQYKHMIDMAPDRLSLQNMEKKVSESFREYAQRWRDLASQVQPSLTEKEMTVFFVNTLQGPYYDKLVGNITKNFADMVISGEMIENAIKNGKIRVGDHDTSENEGLDKAEEEKETQAINFEGWSPGNPASHQSFSVNLPTMNMSDNPYLQQPFLRPVYPAYFQPQTNATDSVPTFVPTPRSWNQPRNTGNDPKKPRSNQRRNRVASIPMSYTELLPQLIQNHLVIPIQTEPLMPPYPNWYNADESCDYHCGNPGHSTESCPTLKYKVRDLIKAGLLSFDENGELIVMGHSLLNQDGANRDV